MATRVKHQFGGEWTEQKLDILKKYLEAYCLIFDRNENARYFDTWYVDAFAGTGYISRLASNGDEEISLLGDLVEEENEGFLKGSAVIALEVNPGFKNYLFIDKSSSHCTELEALKGDFPSKNISVVNDEANTALEKWVKSQNWTKTRAVVFLDPYGMQVSWKTVELLANTKGIDLWILLPIGVALNRVLPRNGQPCGKSADRLDDFLGSAEWRRRFYEKQVSLDLFGEEIIGHYRTADINTLGDYVMERLKSVFHVVHPTAKPLMSSKGRPLYLFGFAAGNERGSKTAINIASDLLKDKRLSP